MRRVWLPIVFVLLLASYASAATISLTWDYTPNSDSQQGFRLFRQANSPACSGSWAQIGNDLPADARTYVDSTVTGGVVYCYYVLAFDTGNNPSSGSVPLVITPSGGDFTTGLVAWYKFDEASGTVATDSSDTHTGTLVGSPTPTHTTPQIGTHSLTFNGTSGYVSSILNPPAASSFTVAVWINLASTQNAFGTIYSDRTHGLYTVKHSNNTVSIRWYDTYWADSFTPLTLSTWHHIVAVYDATTQKMSFYVDKVLQSTYYDPGNPIPGTMFASLPTASTLAIGGDATNGLFAGVMDDLRVYSRVLNGADIASLFDYR